jgi:hypothetical protein
VEESGNGLDDEWDFEVKHGAVIMGVVAVSRWLSDATIP